MAASSSSCPSEGWRRPPSFHTMDPYSADKTKLDPDDNAVAATLPELSNPSKKDPSIPALHNSMASKATARLTHSKEEEEAVVDVEVDNGRKAYLARHDAVAPSPPLHSAHRYDDEEEEEEENEDREVPPSPVGGARATTRS